MNTNDEKSAVHTEDLMPFFHHEDDDNIRMRFADTDQKEQIPPVYY